MTAYPRHRDIAIGMVTVDRSPSPNFLATTLDNLHRAGVFVSARLHSFYVANSGVDEFAYRTLADRGIDAVANIPYGPPASRRTANRNVAAALQLAAESGAPWVLFLEDDIDVCARFLDSVGSWLDENAEPTDAGPTVYAFGAAYDSVAALHRLGIRRWNYDVNNFYGTQAFAIPSDAALDLADWISFNEYLLNQSGTAYDILMHLWAKARGISTFYASVPSFVQHIGTSSVISPRPQSQIHTFSSWPGREWAYRPKGGSR